jgi:Na+/H+ antiporter family protein
VETILNIAARTLFPVRASPLFFYSTFEATGMDLLLNPIILSVLVLCVLCLVKVNVLFALILAAITAGLTGGIDIGKTMSLLANGFSANATTALSYILLGTFAVAIAHTGLMQVLVAWISRHVGTRRGIFCMVLAFIACLSQNVVPVHIAFIPLLIPPLIYLMNKMQIDRRAVACSLSFGLKAPYITLPIGFGLIFQGIVADSMTQSGMKVTVSDVSSVNWILGGAMFIGLLIAVFVLYRKPRQYENRPVIGMEKPLPEFKGFELKHWATLLAIALAVAVQLVWESLPLAALIGLMVMILGRAFLFKELDEHISGGISMMGFIAFVMLIAGGYAAILKETGAVNELIQGVVPYLQTNKVLAATIITAIGLVVTMGIGTSFGTVPILAVIYVPLCSAVGFSIPATILLMSAAGALGDAGSPASDTTLGPTCGLNADGQHDHIWDTCVPTFIAYNIPLMIAGIVGSQFI